MKILRSLFIGFIFSLSLVFFASASDLVFHFTNPSFGGNPLYGSYYLQSAQMQNIYKGKGGPHYKPKSLIERFTDSFTNRLLYRMSDYMLDKLFGDNGQLSDEPEHYSIGTFDIDYNPGDKNFEFTITDTSTGQTTTIEIPNTM